MNSIRTRRKALGLTQERLSELAGVSRQTLVRLETMDAETEVNTTTSTLIKIARVLQCSVDDIFLP